MYKIYNLIIYFPKEKEALEKKNLLLVMISRVMARFVFNVLMVAVMVIGSDFSDIRNAEVDILLKKLNKPALKSIKVSKNSGLHKK